MAGTAAIVVSSSPFLAKFSSPKSWRPNGVSLNFTSALFSTTTTGVLGLVRAAANSNGDEPEGSPILSEEDLAYLGKLGAGSVVGAAAIKYGSAIFPEITRPDITEALLIISFPVVVVLLLLLWLSFSGEKY